MPDNIGGDGLEHQDGIGPHPIAVMESLRHAEDHHVIFFLRPVHIGPFIRYLPGEWLNLGGIACKNSSLSMDLEKRC